MRRKLLRASDREATQQRSESSQLKLAGTFVESARSAISGDRLFLFVKLNLHLYRPSDTRTLTRTPTATVAASATCSPHIGSTGYLGARILLFFVAQRLPDSDLIVRRNEDHRAAVASNGQGSCHVLHHDRPLVWDRSLVVDREPIPRFALVLGKLVAVGHR